MSGARHYRELIAWQLADQLRVDVFKFTRREPFTRDLKHRGQTEDAIDSVCRNIAEGFPCESHDEFARFLEISMRSLNELFDSLRSAQLKCYVTSDELVPINALGRRLFPALGRLEAYLRRTGKRAQQRSKPVAPDKRKTARTDRTRDRTDENADRTDTDRDRTDKRERDRTDKGKSDRTDERVAPTDKREKDRTDPR
jgi:four helix bundle protein